MGNPVVHWELMSKEPAKVAAFYEKIFGWKIQHRPEMNYRIVDTASQIHVEEQKVPGMGKFSLFTDPEGRMMGLWKTKT
jgi:predicted enzyme related to lactoylglutathione lyase